MQDSGALYFFSVVNICIELSLYAVAVRFLDYSFFLLQKCIKIYYFNKVVRGFEPGTNNYKSSYQTAVLTRDELAESCF